MSGKSKVVFRVNLGSRDAESHGLDHAKCTTGNEMALSQETADWLVSSGHATAIKEQLLKAVPSKPQIADAKEPGITE